MAMGRILVVVVAVVTAELTLPKSQLRGALKGVLCVIGSLQVADAGTRRIVVPPPSHVMRPVAALSGCRWLIRPR